MLLNKPFSDGDVISMKLISGEEVVARFRGETPDTITLEKPMSLVNTPQGIGLIPYMFTVDDSAELVIGRSVIMVCVVTRKETANDYLQRTTGLQMVS